MSGDMTRDAMNMRMNWRIGDIGDILIFRIFGSYIDYFFRQKVTKVLEIFYVYFAICIHLVFYYFKLGNI
jgi:hypothetical protein